MVWVSQDTLLTYLAFDLGSRIIPISYFCKFLDIESNAVFDEANGVFNIVCL